MKELISIRHLGQYLHTVNAILHILWVKKVDLCFTFRNERKTKPKQKCRVRAQILEPRTPGWVTHAQGLNSTQGLNQLVPPRV